MQAPPCELAKRGGEYSKAQKLKMEIQKSKLASRFPCDFPFSYF
jgi:hypothetical protein